MSLDRFEILEVLVDVKREQNPHQSTLFTNLHVWYFGDGQLVMLFHRYSYVEDFTNTDNPSARNNYRDMLSLVSFFYCLESCNAKYDKY